MAAHVLLRHWQCRHLRRPSMSSLLLQPPLHALLPPLVAHWQQQPLLTPPLLPHQLQKKWKKCNQKIYIKYDKLKAHKSEKAFKNISKKKRKKLILNWMKSIRKQQQLQATIAKVNNTILWHVKKAFKTFYSTEKEEERETFLYRM